MAGNKKEDKQSKKEAARLKKQLMLEKQAEDKRKEEEMQALRKRVAKLLVYRNPTPPLAHSARCMPLLHENPWILIHNQPFAHRLLDELQQVIIPAHPFIFLVCFLCTFIHTCTTTACHDHVIKITISVSLLSYAVVAVLLGCLLTLLFR